MKTLGSTPNSELLLKWESPYPIGENNFSQPEYKVLSISTRETTTIYKEPGGREVDSLPWVVGRKISNHECPRVTNVYQLFFSDGNYSTLMVDFLLKREIGQYVIEYYVPSMLLVELHINHCNHGDLYAGDDELGLLLAGPQCCSWPHNSWNLNLADLHHLNQEHRVGSAS